VRAPLLTTLLLAWALGGVVFADIPVEARSLFEKAELAREEGKLTDAAPLYKKAIELHPLYWKAHSGYLSALRGIGDFAQAAALYERLVADHPSEIDLKVLQAAAAPYAETLAPLTTIVGANPENARAWLELGRTKLALGDTREADDALGKAIRYKAGAAAHVLLGDVYLRDERFRNAQKEYKEALSAEADYVPAQLRMALCSHRLGKSEDTLQALAKLVDEANYPRLVAAHWLIAIISSDLKKYEDALKAVDRVLAVSEGNFDALLTKGYILLDAGKPAEAAIVFTQLATTSPNSSIVLFALGWAHEVSADAPEIQDAQRKERLAKAAEAYEKCAAIDPKVRPRDSLGFVYLLAGKHPEAMKEFKKANDVNPDYAPTVNNLGLGQDLADNRAQAKRRYEEVLDKIDKKNARAHVMLGLDHWIDGSAPKAIKELKEALKINPEDDLTWTFLGDVHYDNGKVRDAINAYEKATQINDRNFWAWYHMGIAYDEDKNKLDDAERCYEKARAARADPPVDLLLRLATINDVDALERPDRALQYYQHYIEAGGTAEWVPARIEELKQLLGGKK
jgi:tetratricopeptide (TPR) repeat protein